MLVSTDSLFALLFLAFVIIGILLTVYVSTVLGVPIIVYFGYGLICSLIGVEDGNTININLPCEKYFMENRSIVSYDNQNDYGFDDPML